MKPSMLQAPFNRRSAVRTIMTSIFLAIIVTGFMWYLEQLQTPLTLTDYVGIPAVILLFGLLQWRFQCRLLASLIGDDDAVVTNASPKTEKPAAQKVDGAAERAKQAGREKRIFLHLVSVLQREGRLMDFFQEDLSLYEDGQIGAAVRSIHESCKKALANYLELEPVMSQNEGDTVDVAAQFDPNAIKLVGNVVGEPPFSGILRHRGWQLRSINLPELGDAVNPDVIAPAEVEVQ